MRARQPPPRIWLMTDERSDRHLERSLMRLPRGAGVVFRHHRTAAPARRQRYEQVRAIARRRGLILVLAGTVRQARAWRADGVHGSGCRRRLEELFHTAPAHDARELANAGAADIVFVSPIFPTHSHAGAPSLGPIRFGLMARLASGRVVALGGMDAARGRRLAPLGAWGWAGIDAWAPNRACDRFSGVGDRR